MYAMIGTCIALAIWTGGLLYMTMRSEKKRVLNGNVEESQTTEDQNSDVVKS